MNAAKEPYTPAFRLHKATGQAFVELGGRRIYLGKHDLPEAREKYHRMISEWLAGGRELPVAQDRIAVIEVVDRFWSHAKGYYRTHEGAPSKTLANFKVILKELKDLYGLTMATSFGPRALKALRERFIKKGYCRKHVNQQVSRVKQVFRWAVSEELVPATIIHALNAVPGLKRGRSDAPESVPVRPVPPQDISKIEPHVSRQVWALVQLQLLTGARPGELLIMRPVDLDTSGTIWIFRPITHKTAYRDRPRQVYLGPKAKKIVRPFLQDRPVSAYMFSPKDAEAERREALHEARRTPQSCGNRPGTNRKLKPKRQPGERYTTISYRRAVERACTAAGVPVWTPGQLRHNAATRVRREFGLEAAQLLLGHAKADVTQLYAEISEAKALKIASQIG